MNILDEIRQKSSRSLSVRKGKIPFAEIYSAAKSAALRPSFASALKRSRDGSPSVIAELKKASPSAGLIRADFRPEELCLELQNAGAAALSVLTEENYFLGSLGILSAVSARVEIPLLCKDFIYDAYQICEAKVCGASAVLLIARMLSPAKFEELADFAESLSLDVLAEAHNEDEIDMLSSCGTKIIGINCRDLKNFSTDFSVVERLAARIPAGIVKVAESAISDCRTFLRAEAAGADAVLVGSSLMYAASPAGKLLEIRGLK